MVRGRPTVSDYDHQLELRSDREWGLLVNVKVDYSGGVTREER